jgi:hypothetical protein
MNTPKNSTGGCCPPPPCYAVFVRKAGNWIQESVPFDSYAAAQAHAKLTRRARPFVEMTRVRRLPHNADEHVPPRNEPDTMTNQEPDPKPEAAANTNASGGCVSRLVHPWPPYDVDAAPEENETMMLFHLESMANPETTCQQIADTLNGTFGNNRSADEVQEKLWIGN